MVGKIYLLAAQLAREHGFAENGYRVVANCNRDGGQGSFHIHFHVLFRPADGMAARLKRSEAELLFGPASPRLRSCPSVAVAYQLVISIRRGCAASERATRT